jgi:hypothetical protein
VGCSTILLVLAGPLDGSLAIVGGLLFPIALELLPSWGAVNLAPLGRHLKEREDAARRAHARMALLSIMQGASRGVRLRKAWKSPDFYGFCPIEMPFWRYGTKWV